MPPLEHLNILRYGHVYDGGGGMEQYLSDLNRALLARGRFHLTQVQLTSNQDRVGRHEEQEGQLPYTRISLFVDQESHEQAIAGSPGTWDRFQGVKDWIRDRILFSPAIYESTLGERLLMRRSVPKRAGEPSGAGEAVRASHRQNPLDLICLHSAGGADASEILDVAEAEGIPVAYIHHFSNDRLSGLSMRQQLARCRGVAGVCGTDVPNYLRNRFLVVADGIDTHFYRREFARPLSRIFSDPLIFLPARITPAKGQEELIEAAGVLHREGLSFQLALAGRSDDAAYFHRLQELVNQLGLARRVHFIGQLRGEELRDWYAAASILAFPTRHHEGLPRVLLEAQSMEVPPVVYDVGGTAEGIKDSESGFLVKFADRQEMISRLRQLLTDHPLRTRMGAAGRAFVENRFSLSMLAERHEDFYRRCIASYKTARNTRPIGTRSLPCPASTL